MKIIQWPLFHVRLLPCSLGPLINIVLGFNLGFKKRKGKDCSKDCSKDWPTDCPKYLPKIVQKMAFINQFYSRMISLVQLPLANFTISSKYFDILCHSKQEASSGPIPFEIQLNLITFNHLSCHSSLQM